MVGCEMLGLGRRGRRLLRGRLLSCLAVGLYHSSGGRRSRRSGRGCLGLFCGLQLPLLSLPALSLRSRRGRGLRCCLLSHHTFSLSLRRSRGCQLCYHHGQRPLRLSRQLPLLLLWFCGLG
jgi:hypothetical protein